MSGDKIAEIRERWAEFESLDHQSQVWDAHLYMRRAHNDRATLLAEIERLRAENEQLRAALEGIRIDGPDAHGLVWATIQHPSIAARSHAMIGSMDRMVSQALLEFEQIRRKALEGKP